MKLSEVAEILNAEVLAGGDKLDREVHAACGSDMMSDVLAYVKDQGMLLTGLTNPQVIRTASMMDMLCVAFLRGKRPDAAVVQLASDLGIVVVASSMSMFTACGLLYEKGLCGEEVAE